MDNVFDVFVIGPMGKGRDAPEEKNTPISKHMKNIESALKIVLPDLCPSLSKVWTPERGGSDIINHVFNLIDRADLAIADITSRSPSVMYELAYFHALGTPVIVLDIEQNSSETTPFYLKGVNIVRVPDFEVDTLVEAIGVRLRMFFNPRDDQDFSMNPITGFYSAPLVEVSGANSIARGYYRNMVDGFLNAVGGVVALSTDETIKSFTVIKPDPNFKINEDFKKIGEITKKWNKGETLQERVWKVNVAGRERKFGAYFINGHVYDYPRTMGTLNNSPRLIRLSSRGLSKSGGTVAQETIQQNRAKITRSLIDTFFEVIDREIIRNEDGLFPDMYRKISLQQFEKELNA